MIKSLYTEDCYLSTEQKVAIPFEFKDKTHLPKGERLKSEITISPITVRTWFRIKPLLIQIDTEDIQKIIATKESPYPAHAEEMLAKYDDIIIDIICLGIHNGATMPEWYKDVLVDNSTWTDLLILLNAILYRVGYASFCKSITTLKNVSPIDVKGMIAFTTNLESWKEHQKAASDS